MASIEAQKYPKKSGPDRPYPLRVSGLKTGLFGRCCLSHSLETIKFLKTKYKKPINRAIDYINVDDVKNPRIFLPMHVEGTQAVPVHIRAREVDQVVEFYNFLRDNVPKQSLYHFYCGTCHPTPIHFAFTYLKLNENNKRMVIPRSIVCIPEGCKMDPIEVIVKVAEKILKTGESKNIVLQKLRSGKFLNYSKVIAFVADCIGMKVPKYEDSDEEDEDEEDEDEEDEDEEDEETPEKRIESSITL